MSDLQSTDALEEAISRCVSVSKLSVKEIFDSIDTSHKDQWSKKQIKQMLKQLVSQGRLHKESNKYFISNHTTKSSNSGEEKGGHESNDELMLDDKKSPSVPIGQRMRKQSLDVDVNVKESKQPEKVDLDEEIRRLEAELAADSSSDEDDESDESIGSENKKRKISFGQNSTYTIDSNKKRKDIPSDLQSGNEKNDSPGVICLSESANERIEPLPASVMPKIARKTPTDQKNRKRDKQEHKINEGLKDAVEDLLSNYKTRSEVEQTPWYCRVCQHQATGEADFISHRESAFHKTAMQEHQKKTYCKMCRKQMTSVVQFEEHLQSRPHKEMSANLRRQQRGWGRGGAGEGRGRGGGRFNGRGAGRVGRGTGSSKRQWC